MLEKVLYIGQIKMNDQLRSAFEYAFQDRLEPEFPISKENIYHKIIDLNHKGSEAYNGLIQDECLIGT